MSKKVLIIGCPGSGKSTLARQLNQFWKLELIHLDTIYHDAKLWSVDPVKKKMQWRKHIESISSKDSWLMDGNYTSSLDIRILRADLVIFLDYPRYVSLIRAIKRRFVYNKKPRPDMPIGWKEKFNLNLLKKIWNFKHTHKPRIEKLLEGKVNQTVVILRTPNEAREYLMKISEK